MNYFLHVAECVRKEMVLDRSLTAEEALTVVWEDMGREFVAGGNVVMPPDCLILLIDADTRVPEDCMHEVCGALLYWGSPGCMHVHHPVACGDCDPTWSRH
jgi:hypothetical protein